jgi:hypothetical protein
MRPPRAKDFLILLGLTVGALLVHGYHPYVEDAEIYLPGVLKQLHPSLFPHNAAFFESYSQLTLFPRVLATSIRAAHIPFNFGLLAWHLITIFLLLYSSWRIARICFKERYAVWCGVGLVAALLTIPVAGTSLYIMDQYLTARSLSTPAAVAAVASALEGGFIPAMLWIIFAGFVHPLMSVFAAVLVILILVLPRLSVARIRVQLPLAGSLFPPVTSAYKRVLETRPYFFVTQWEWFEWLGILGPAAILEWFRRMARSRKLERLELTCKALLIYQAIFFAAALVVSVEGKFENLAELQPLRSLQLLYIMLFLFGGGFLAEFVLRKQVLRWAALFVPLCFGMWYAQRQLFPSTPHLEWPWLTPRNAWVEAFQWIRVNTPEDAYFALDPQHMHLPGEDEHGFRAIAERSMLADAVKDSGAATMFPALAGEWQEQVEAQKGWKDFQVPDFLRLKRTYGVNWIVKAAAVAGLVCPYNNGSLAVCRLD